MQILICCLTSLGLCKRIDVFVIQYIICVLINLCNSFMGHHGLNIDVLLLITCQMCNIHLQLSPGVICQLLRQLSLLLSGNHLLHCTYT